MKTFLSLAIFCNNAGVSKPQHTGCFCSPGREIGSGVKSKPSGQVCGRQNVSINYFSLAFAQVLNCLPAGKGVKALLNPLVPPSFDDLSAHVLHMSTA